MKKLRWGILSTANIGTQKVVPAIQNANNCEVIAICSRSLASAQSEADKLNIPKAYGSYEALLADSAIDVIYIPLPNHLHVLWTIKAMEAGKHVLCEKPIALNTEEAIHLQEVSSEFPELKLMEAFMYRFHPQWLKVKELVVEGAIGEVKTINSFFSYFNNDPSNIRNKAAIGGGALMDIGCYCISFSRFVFDKEPSRVIGLIDRDPKLKTDRIISGILDFENGLSSNFTCSTQLTPYQRVHIVGTEGRIEVDIPVNAPSDKLTKITTTTADNVEVTIFEATNQYTLQAEAFANAIINNLPVPTDFNDAIANMKVIDAMFKSEANGWVNV